MNLPSCFPEWFHHLTFLPAMHVWSSSFASLWTFDIVTLFHFSHSNRCAVLSHGGFNLRFTNSKRCCMDISSCASLPLDYPLWQDIPSCLLDICELNCFFAFVLFLFTVAHLNFLIYSRYYSFIGCVVHNSFLPGCSLVFFSILLTFSLYSFESKCF